MPGFKLGEGDSEYKDGGKDKDTTGASIGASVSCGVLGGEWESAKMPQVMGIMSLIVSGPENVCSCGVERYICEVW